MMFDQLTFRPNDVWPNDFLAEWCLTNWLSAKWCLSNWLFGRMMFDQLTFGQMMFFDKLTLWPNGVWPIDFWAKWCLTDWLSNWLLGQMMFDQLDFWLNDVVTLFFHCRININDLTAVWNHRLSSWRRFLPLRRPQLRQSEDVRRQRDVLLRRRRGKQRRRNVLERAGLNLIKLFSAVNYELSL